MGREVNLFTFEQLSNFYRGKNVLVTGHTGFKGTWMCSVLGLLGANVVGYALSPELSSENSSDNMFEICEMGRHVNSIIGDIRDRDYLLRVFKKEKPDIVIHMAAQPIVRESYRIPVETYEINVMGTVNVLECIRKTESVKSLINVTTDKVYRNEERKQGYKENEYLDGYDPYSNSKSCSELVTSSYRNSFFINTKELTSNIFEMAPSVDGFRACALSTCRAGNVIGGGDFAKERIIPDCVRAVKNNKKIIVRNPSSIRPYQHVLEPVVLYLELAMYQCLNPSLSGAYNIGPEEKDCIPTGVLVDMFISEWNAKNQANNVWISTNKVGPHEAEVLKLDCTKIKTELGWKPRWALEECMKMLVEWYSEWAVGKNMYDVTRRQIEEYFDI